MRAIDELLESVERATAGVEAFTLDVRRIDVRPTSAEAKQIAAITDVPAPLRQLKDRLVRRVARARHRRGEFELRLPLVRFDTPRPVDFAPIEVEDLSFPVAAVTVYRSVIAHGAYEVRGVEEFPLERRHAIPPTAEA